jgi:xanthine/CO dehydrogenase XdhC/CoxF family maturation factor
LSELTQISTGIEELGDEEYVLATVVAISGSTYRLPGAKQLLSLTRGSVGTVSGGCLDADLVRVAEEVIATGEARFISYDLTADDDEIWGFGLGCNGVTELLVEPPDSAGALINALVKARDDERTMAVVTLLHGDAVGRRVLVDVSGSVEGTLGDEDADRAAQQAAMAAMDEGRHATAEVPLGRAFVEVQIPPPRLLICGAGHDAIPLVRIGSQLGWRVVVVDDRPAYLTAERFPEAGELIRTKPSELADHVSLDRRTDCVVMTHNYLRDVDYVGVLLNSRVRYLGLLGPHARTIRILDDLAERGIEGSRETLARVYAPAGLDIGAEGPEQIAWAILAEILAVTQGRTGGPLRDRKGPIHEGLADGGSPMPA